MGTPQSTDGRYAADRPDPSSIGSSTERPSANRWTSNVVGGDVEAVKRHDAGDGRPGGKTVIEPNLPTTWERPEIWPSVVASQLLAVRLLLKPSSLLTAANFSAKSLLHIAGGKHKEMQELLDQWLVLRGLDAAISSGGDAGE